MSVDLRPMFPSIYTGQKKVLAQIFMDVRREYTFFFFGVNKWFSVHYKLLELKYYIFNSICVPQSRSSDRLGLKMPRSHTNTLLVVKC